MIMAGFEFMGKEPFKDVYIHGTVRDIEGKKMSKSLGNIIDPLEVINEYGADALRFSLISITAQGQDVFLSKERFEQGRNFANKIWNASRFILMNLNPQEAKVDLCVFFDKEKLDIINRWILSRFYSVLKETTKYLQDYKFNEAANLLYGFFWHEFCDWYVEMIKPDIKSKHNQVVMYKVLEKFLRAIHPFMPFISEEIWQKLQGQSPSGTVPVRSIMIEPWPHIQAKIIDKKIDSDMESVFQVITAIRNMRQELEIPLLKEIDAHISSENKTTRILIELMSAQIKNLAKLASLKVEPKHAHFKSSVTMIIKDMHVVIPLEGVVDIQKELAKISGRIQKTDSEIKSKVKTLSNKDFLKHAPEDVVAKEKSRLKELKDTLKRLKVIKDELR
jgi:valyl-tRNA synthetase